MPTLMIRRARAECTTDLWQFRYEVPTVAGAPAQANPHRQSNPFDFAQGMV
jgi:hypothetical protein